MKRKTFTLIGIILTTIFISNIAFVNRTNTVNTVTSVAKLDKGLYCEHVDLNYLIETRSIRISNLF